MTSAHGAPRSVLGRVTLVLNAFDERSPQLSLTDLAHRTGLPPSTVHRLAAELVEWGFLQRDEHRRYAIGPKLWEWGELSPLSFELRERALPFLLELYETVGENVHLAVLSGRDALYVARLVGPRSVPTISRMGGRLPLHTTGVGKVLLAGCTDLEVSDYLAAPLATPTPYSVTEPDRVRAEVAEIRAQDFAFASQEMTLGNLSIAVPVRRGGRVVAALGLVTHLSRSDAKRLLPGLRRAARGIESALARP